MTRFDEAVVTAVLEHMNGDHGNDSLEIVQANGAPRASSAVMTDFDREGAEWSVEEPEGARLLRVVWPIPVAERSDVRSAIVELHRAAVRDDGSPITTREEHTK